MRNKRIHFLVFVISLSAGMLVVFFARCGGCGEKSVFGNLNKGCSQEDIGKIIDHDMSMLTEILFHPPGYQKLAAYYMGVIKWIEEHGDKKHLPFLEKVLNEYKDLNMLKYSSGYFNNYSKGSLYELALSAWYKIKTRDMEDEEIVEMIIESLKASSSLPNINESAWIKYKTKIVEKRDKIYNILKEKEINPLYDFMCPLSEWTLSDILSLEGLNPTEKEISEFIEIKDGLIADNIIIYLFSISNKKMLNKYFEMILMKYNKTDNYSKFLRYDQYIYNWLNMEDNIKVDKIQKALIKKLEKTPKPWEFQDNITLNKILYVLIKIKYIKKEYLDEDTVNYLIKYKENIEKNIEKIKEPPARAKLKDFIKRLDRMLKK